MELLGPTTELVINDCHVKSTFCPMSQSKELFIVVAWMIFLICGQLLRNPLIELFHLSSLLQMPNGYRMVDVDFSGNFSCSFEHQL